MSNISTASVHLASFEIDLRTRKLRAITLCALLLIFDGYDIGSIGYVLPALARAWGKAPSDLTFAIVLSGIGMLVGSMIAGPLGDLRGRKPVFIACVALFGAFSTASAFVETPQMLAVMRFLTGLGLGGGVPTAVALTSDFLPPKNRPIIVGALTCGIPIGLILSGLTSSWLVPSHGWQAVFLVGGIVPLVLLPLLVWLLPESIQFLLRSGRAPRSAEAMLGALGDDSATRLRNDNASLSVRSRNLVGRLFRDGFATRTLLLWVMMFCNFLATWLVIFWLPTILSAGGAADSDAAFYSALLPVGGLLGVGAIVLLIRRLRTELALSIFLFFGAVATLTMGTANLSGWVAAAIIVLIGSGLQGAQFGMNGLCGSVYPTEIRATGSGWAFGIGRIGNIIGPGLGGLLLALALPPRTMLLVSAGAGTLAAMAMFALDRHRAGDARSS